MSLARAAAWYARHGWRVFPCKPGCKEPAIKAWQRLATANELQIASWWNARPDSNVGLACGPESGVWALDVDQHDEDGEASLRHVLAMLGALPTTIEQRTGSGGRQLLFAYPHGRDCRNSTGKLGPGLDVRGTGGFIVLPPSLHPCGVPYAWVTGPHIRILATLPARWIQRVAKPPAIRLRVPITPLRSLEGPDRKWLEQRVRELATTGEGARNDLLYRHAFWARCRCVEGSLSWREVHTVLAQAARAAGLDPAEISKTLASASKGAVT